MKTAQKLIRWVPFLVFTAYVLITVGMKDRSGPRSVATIRPEAAENCTRICDRLAECALSHFGRTETNLARVPALKTNCYSGCVRKEGNVEECFTPDNDIHCVALTACTIHFLQQSQ